MLLKIVLINFIQVQFFTLLKVYLMVTDNRKSKANNTSTSKIVTPRCSSANNSLRHLQEAALQVGRTDHPIDNLISNQDIAHIKLYARQASNMKLTYVTSHHLTHITTESLRELLSHGTMIID